MNLKSIEERINRLEEKLKPPMRYRRIHYHINLKGPEEANAAAEAAAIAEEEAANGPILDTDFVIHLRCVNYPRQQSTQPEAIAGPPQIAPETRTAPEAIHTPPVVDPEAERAAERERQREEQRQADERRFQQAMNRDSVRRFDRMYQDDDAFGGF